VDLNPAPLAGWTLAAEGCPVIRDVTRRLLGALGCAEATGRRTAGDRSAARFALGGPGRPVVRADVDWAGPVVLPLVDEGTVQAACGVAAAGALAAQGLLAALLWGHTQATTSVAQAALLTVGQHLAAATAPDAVSEPGLPGGPPFVSADGVRFEIETLDAEPWSRFWSALGAAPEAIRQGWPPFQHRFATGTCPLPADLHAVVARYTYPDLRAAATRAGVATMDVRTTVPDLPPWTLHAEPGPSGHSSDLRVVEVTRRVQGPLIGHLLRLLGADVTRIEPVGGDPLRGVPPMVGDCSARFLALNRGKQVVEADLRTDAATVRALDADVFVHNLAPGRAEAYNLDRAGNRVYAHADGWGDTLGPNPPIGTDYLVQAYSGLSARQPSLLTLTDVFGGLVATTGILGALLAPGRHRLHSSLLSGASVLAAACQRHTTVDTAAPRTDLATVAADPAFAKALERDGCALPATPWEFA